MNATSFFFIVAILSAVLSFAEIDITVTVVTKLLFLISVMLFLLSLLGRYVVIPDQRQI